MGRAPCCDKDGLKKGPWTAEEDQKLIDYIQKQGSGNWRTLPKNAGLQRCGKSCRLRWINYLRPDIKRGRFSVEEEETMIQMHGVLGNKWSAIAARLPGRTDNEIKNYWNTRIRKRLLRMGIDPVTHAPRLDLLNISTILNASNRINIHNMLGGEQTLVNPEILRIASVLYSQQRDTNYVFQDQSQYQQPPWIKSELHGQEVDQVAGGCVSFTNEATTMQQQQQQQPCNGEEDYNYVPNLTNNYDDSYYFVPEQDHFLNPLSESSYPTVLSSTPSSSISTPIHSTSTFTNGGGGGGGEDERESYSSQYSLNDESIADFLDMDSSWNDIQQLLAGQSEFPAVPWSIC